MTLKRPVTIELAQTSHSSRESETIDDVQQT
jgi:hypothetical protein